MNDLINENTPPIQELLILYVLIGLLSIMVAEIANHNAIPSCKNEFLIS